MTQLRPTTSYNRALTLGANRLSNGTCHFRFWAPRAEAVTLHVVAPEEVFVEMTARSDGYHVVTLPDCSPDLRYTYQIGDQDYPDPASRWQPDGIDGSSALPAADFPWTDTEWRGLPLEQYILYELHVGTYTPEGTFDAIIPHLDTLVALGITAIELMPVAQFPNDRNWGYDGVFVYAPQNTYGGPDGLRRLVNACHERGMAVVLDVVYNHFGPEGNFIGDYGYYFSDSYTSIWGSPLNFDGPYSSHVRRFFIENALYWLNEFHIDALRLDATHAILDFSARTFLEELVAAVEAARKLLHRHVFLIAENANNDARLTRAQAAGGIGMDAQWNDDFHHALRTLITQERTEYYQDYGQFEQLVKAFREGFVFSGQYSGHRKRYFGTSSRHLPPSGFVVFSQNHDHVGNRMLGDRPGQLLSLAALKLMAGTVLMSPYIPLLFMGEEYNEPAPFLYFVSFNDPDLARAVHIGRKNEFKELVNQGEPPDPQAPDTFRVCKLNHHLREQDEHFTLWCFYCDLLALRKRVPALRHLSKEHMEVTGFPTRQVLVVRRWFDGSEIVFIANYGAEPATLMLPVPAGRWQKLISSEPGQSSEGLADTDSIPLNIDSRGEVPVSVPPGSFILFERNIETNEEPALFMEEF
jgi:maltooligosyltrehalose trehalohydrolase